MAEINLSYPVGKFVSTDAPDAAHFQLWIRTIADFPAQLRQAVNELDDAALRWRYRPGGWTIRQVVHHCADSHMNAYTRFKLALTEEHPGIKPYNESAWAELADSQLPLEPSLILLEGLHQRWTALLEKMTPADFEATFFHPEHGTVFSFSLALETYDWHCRHHLAHVLQAKELCFEE